MRGRISIRRQGAGFVRPEKPGKPGNPGKKEDWEVYIAPHELGGAWDGDLVLLTVISGWPGQAGQAGRIGRHEWSEQSEQNERSGRNKQSGRYGQNGQNARNGRSGKNPEGRVLEVLERRISECAVRLLPQMVREDGRDKFLARSLDNRQSGYLLVDVSALTRSADPAEAMQFRVKTPRPGDLLLVSLLPMADQKNDGVIRALAISDLGSENNIALHERLVKATHGIRTVFPQAALDEAVYLEEPENTPAHSALPHRDLSDLAFVTIDGADARDFDDAIFVDQVNQGYVLRVAIADVAHYVLPGSALDLEAKARGNSCYFPASVEPMLPEALSNGLCSLQPGRLRLAMVAEIEFDAAGNAGQTAFYPACIRSQARLTYEGAQAALDQCQSAAGQNAAENQAAQMQSLAAPVQLQDAPEQHTAESQTWLPMLRLAAKLATRLLEKRRARGALDFELPEPLILLEKHDGHQEIQNLAFRERLFTHRLIEEFMIAANEAVARHLATYANLSFLYRAHAAPDPEKLGEFFSLMERNGLWKPGDNSAMPLNDLREQNADFGSKRNGPRKQHARPSPARDAADSAIRPGDLQRILDQARNSPEAFVVNRLLLRSLMQARYTPQAEGHFGLASEAYCHFTSPIRRYADLTVHRALRHSLGLPLPIPSFQALSVLAESLNENERKAVEAERDMNKICGALFMQKLDERDPGREFPAVVAGLSSYGLFVELEDFPLEGFLPVENLPDDFYHLDAAAQMLIGMHKGLLYRLGQPLLVRLQTADPGRMEVRFVLSQNEAGKNGKKFAGKNSKKAKPGKKQPYDGNKPKTDKKKFKPGSVRLHKQNI
ncbi:MAG: RNB domain-containing ribonuclease [Deltaproteobacteria bacterium]|nr:RNB domain-containing ribonuclease [Deltaproteobacteria bacterium]